MPNLPSTRRVVFVSPGWPAGAVQNGIVTYVAHVRDGLKALGVESHVLAREVIGSDDPSVHNLPVYAGLPRAERFALRVGYRISPRMSDQEGMRRELVRGVRRINSEWPFDLFEIEESFGLSQYLDDVLTVPTVVRLHGPWFLNADALGMPRDANFAFRDDHERRAILGAAGLSSPSLDVLERVRKRYGVELRDAEVVPNPGPVIEASERWSYAGCDPKLVLFVGRFDRHKGGDVMLDAFAQVGKALPEAKLMFVGPDRGLTGDGGREWTLKDYASERLPDDVRGRVELTGPLSGADIAALRRRALVTVVPSRYENFPMTMLEAMAYGSPIVTSASGGIAEMVRDGETARVFENGSPESLAKVLIDVLEQPEQTAGLGERALRHSLERYTPEVVGRDMLAFYDRVRERHARAANKTSRR